MFGIEKHYPYKKFESGILFQQPKRLENLGTGYLSLAGGEENYGILTLPEEKGGLSLDAYPK